jgi:hypothetical protein
MNLLTNNLLAIIFGMMIIIPVAGAQINNPSLNPMNHLNIQLENKNVTNVIAYDETSKANLSSYNIQKPEELWIPAAVNKFDAVTFDHATFNDQLKSGKGILVSIGGKDYQAELSRMKFENNTDGVYSYYGTLLGVNNSSILFTTRKNVIFGRIISENDTYWIIPVEPRARTEISQSPLHIIYSSKDVKNVEFPIDKQPDTINSVGSPEINPNLISNLQLTPPDQFVYVDILVVTDSEFYNSPDWLGSAYNIINNANMVLERDNIKVYLFGHYDASRRNQFLYTTDPISLFMNVYPTPDLDSYSTSWPPDIALYLGGYDILNDPSQGATWGFTSPPDKCRYAWAQMVYDDLGYIGTPHGQAIISLHEIGHIFDADHENANRPLPQPQYMHAIEYFDTMFPFDHKTVMWSEYSESASTFEFSSFSSSYCGVTVFCHGDNIHDNARRISETRDTVAMYAHKDKIGVFRPGNGNWYFNYNYSSAVQKTFHFGTTGDIPVTGDFNGDGFTDAGVFRPSIGNWYFDYDLNGVKDKEFHFGKTGDIPVTGDFNGNGVSDVAVFRPSNGYWYFDYDLNGVVDTYFQFGTTGDIPVVGNWDGNGVSDIGIFRPSSQNWALDTNKNSAVEYSFHFGIPGDIPVVGDFNGNEVSDVAVFRSSNGYWYFDYDLNGIVDSYFQFGSTGDIPIIGDWNGGGYSHAGVYRPSNGNWYLASGEVGTITFHFGLNGDKPNVGVWKRENI